MAERTERSSRARSTGTMTDGMDVYEPQIECAGNEYKVLVVYLVMTIYGTHTCTYVLRSPG